MMQVEVAAGVREVWVLTKVEGRAPSEACVMPQEVDLASCHQ